MPSFTDQLNRTITLPAIPRRIVSLVPSQTELLAHLGLDNEVVGITQFCIHPDAWFRSKKRVGGTKNVHIDWVHDLQPDLILANKEENVQEQVEELARHYPVWVSDVHTLEDALAMIRSVGALTHTTTQATATARAIEAAFAAFKGSPAPVNTAYLIWQAPYMTTGSDTFIHHLLERCGLVNVFRHKTRYPVVTIEELQAADCALLLLATEPYPFKQHHVDQLQPLLPHTRILLADGELFSWYGSRLLEAPAYFEALLKRLHSSQFM